MTDKPLGLYLHFPFCEKKCRYCDFYSRVPSGDGINGYIGALIKEIEKWGGEVNNRPIDTIYIGGGTPSLSGERITDIMAAVRKNFNVLKNAEITAEVNPESAERFLCFAKESGINRISVGAQSGSDEFLKELGRVHTAKQTEKTVSLAKKCGFTNISADLMIGLMGSNAATLKRDTDFILSLDVPHISAYILKIEKGTALYKSGAVLPDGDAVAEQYLYLCDRLSKEDYIHYEISNFAKKGYESRHNLKYWNDLEYIGIGPAAHSFYGGKRFYYPRDIKRFTAGDLKVEEESSGGDRTERLMLALRLKSGVKKAEFADRLPLLEKLAAAGYIEEKGEKISLTDRGMLVSNSVITELIL